MSKPLTIYTYDWVPAGENGPRGFVRDARLRWACKEAGMNYEVKAVPIREKGPEHYARQPFGQIPFMEDGDITIFESGACLLYLAKKSEKLMPRDPKGEAETLEWTIAALNSIEMVSVPWWYLGLKNEANNPMESWLLKRLKHLDAVLSAREYLVAGRFTVADLIMADVLRVPKVRALEGFPGIHRYVDQMLSRPAFQQAYEEQLAHFAKGD